jgi:hypothetical protein
LQALIVATVEQEEEIARKRDSIISLPSGGDE